MELETSTNVIKLDSPTVSSSNNININFDNNQSTTTSSIQISNGISSSSQISNLEQVQITTSPNVPVAEITTSPTVPVAEHPKLFSTLSENFNNQITQNKEQDSNNNLPVESSSINGVGIEQMTSQNMNAATDEAILLMTAKISSNVTTNPVLETSSVIEGVATNLEQMAATTSQTQITQNKNQDSNNNLPVEWKHPVLETSSIVEGVATNLEQMAATTSQTGISTSNQIIGNVGNTSQNANTNPMTESSTSNITEFVTAIQETNETIISSESPQNFNSSMPPRSLPMPESTISKNQISPIPDLPPRSLAINDQDDYLDSDIANLPDFTSIEDSELLPGLNHPIEPLPGELSDQKSHLDEPLQVEHQNLDGGDDEAPMAISNIGTISTRR